MTLQKTARIEKIVAVFLILLGLIQGIGHIYYWYHWNEFTPKRIDDSPIYLQALYIATTFKSFSIKSGYVIAGALLFKNRRIGWIIAIITLSFTSVSILTRLIRNEYYWNAPIIVWHLLPLFLLAAIVLPQVQRKYHIQVHSFIIYVAIGIALHLDSLLMIIARNESLLPNLFK